MRPVRSRSHPRLSLTLALLGLCLAAAGLRARATTDDGRVFLPLAIGRPAFAAVPLGSGFDQVTAITHAGDDRLFVVERAGRIKVLHPDGHVTLFLDISAQVIASPGEYGMYDLAFHPGYADPDSPGHGFFYVSYTGRDQGAVRLFIARFRATPDGQAADPASETWLLNIEQTYSWHKGGELDFDPATAALYAGLGEDRQPLLAQSSRSRKGKIIRLVVDDVPAGITGNATFYVENEIIASGLRNPWRFDFDPPTRRLFIGDVGDLSWEEINLAPIDVVGTNFGWPCVEGTDVIDLFAPYAECKNPGRFQPPIAQYAHDAEHCAIIGGKVYRPATNPTDGRFIYGDLCSRDLLTLSFTGGAWQSTLLGQMAIDGLLTTLGEDVHGGLLAGTTAAPGPIYQLIIP